MANHALDSTQVEHYNEEGYLIVRDLLPPPALKPLIAELEQKVDEAAEEAVQQGLLDASDTFAHAPFDTRLARMVQACADPTWLWQQVHGKQHKTAGMFTLRTWPALLDVAESLIGPEILAHPQTVLRASLPETAETVVPWHQDLAYLNPEEAGETLIVNFWIPLVEATAENGCLQVIAGSHRAGLLPHDHRETIYIGVGETDMPEGDIVTCEVQPGDVLLTTERLLHRSLPNRSEIVRWSVDSRYCRIGLPTGRPSKPGFVARSRRDSGSVTGSHHEWRQLFVDAGLDWTEKKKTV